MDTPMIPPRAVAPTAEAIDSSCETTGDGEGGVMETFGSPKEALAASSASCASFVTSEISISSLASSLTSSGSFSGGVLNSDTRCERHIGCTKAFEAPRAIINKPCILMVFD